MATQNLTQNETQLLKEIAKGLYAEFGYSDILLEDICESNSWDIKSYRGVLSSLLKKGYLWIDEFETQEFVRTKRGIKTVTVRSNLIHVVDEKINEVREITGVDFWSDYEGVI